MKPIIFILMLLTTFQSAAQSVTEIIRQYINQEPNVEISLGEGMLSLLSEMSEEQTETAKIIQKIKQIEVRVYQLEGRNDDEYKQIKAKINNTAKQLKQSGLEQLTTLREEDSLVFIMAKTNQQQIQGISVMALDEDDELITIEINGAIQPKDLGLLIKKFGIDLD